MEVLFDNKTFVYRQLYNSGRNSCMLLYYCKKHNVYLVVKVSPDVDDITGGDVECESQLMTLIGRKNELLVLIYDKDNNHVKFNFFYSHLNHIDNKLLCKTNSLSPSLSSSSSPQTKLYILMYYFHLGTPLRTYFKTVIAPTSEYEDDDYVVINQVIFTEYQIRNMLGQLLNQVHNIHHVGYCHRDIRLANIIYNLNSDTYRLINFNLCYCDKQKVNTVDINNVNYTLDTNNVNDTLDINNVNDTLDTNNVNDTSEHDRGKQMVGTLYYTYPPLLQRLIDVNLKSNQRSDLYAIGVCAYYCFNNRFPYPIKINGVNEFEVGTYLGFVTPCSVDPKLQTYIENLLFGYTI